MLIVISIIAIILAIVFFFMSSGADLLELLAYVALIVLAICLIALVFNVAAIANADTIDQKIALYESENAAIEEKLCETIATYLEHEKDLISNLTPETATTLLVKYPELKSDTLVAAQIDSYIYNHRQLLGLREDKINIEKKKWWVYFG